jgi:hypothetical protein
VTCHSTTSLEASRSTSSPPYRVIHRPFPVALSACTTLPPSSRIPSTQHLPPVVHNVPTPRLHLCPSRTLFFVYMIRLFSRDSMRVSKTLSLESCLFQCICFVMRLLAERRHFLQAREPDDVDGGLRGRDPDRTVDSQVGNLTSSTLLAVDSPVRIPFLSTTVNAIWPASLGPSPPLALLAVLRRAPSKRGQRAGSIQAHVSSL